MNNDDLDIEEIDDIEIELIEDPQEEDEENPVNKEDDDADIELVAEDENAPSMSWKDKASIGNKEVVSRKINRKEALEQDAKDKTNLKSNDGKKVAPIEQMAAGLQKVSTKIKTNAYDEEDEDEKQFQFVGSANDNSLVNALSDSEKKMLTQKTLGDTTRVLQAGDKMGALNVANEMAKSAGGKAIDKKTVNEHMVDATYGKASMEKALNKNIQKELKVKVPGNIPASKQKDLIKGIKKVKEKGGRVNGMNVDDVAKAAKANDKGVAEIIYKSSTTADKKRIHEKSDVKKIIEKTGRSSEKEKARAIDKASVKEIEKGNVKLQNRDRPRGNSR